MSIAAITAVWRHYPASSSGEMVVALALADYADDQGGSIWPSIAALATKARISPSQARRHLRNMEHKGIVEVVGNREGGRPGTTRQLQLNLLLLASLGAATKSGVTVSNVRIRATPRINATPRADARDGLHACSETGGMDDTQTVNRTVITRQTDDLPDGFKRFWSIWPTSARKGARGECLKIWKKNRFEVVSSEICSHVEAMKASKQWREGYDPMPKTYLNRREWEGSSLDQGESRRLAI